MMEQHMEPAEMTEPTKPAELNINQNTDDLDPKVIEIINSILTTQFEVPKENIFATSNLKEDLNLDSLDFVDMVILLEEKLGKSVRDIDFMAIRTVGDIYRLIHNLQKDHS